MPYQYNRELGEWQWTEGPDYGYVPGVDPDVFDPLSEIPMEALYDMAASAAMPGYEASPFKSAYATRLRGPLSGQYAMTLGDQKWEDRTPFHEWLMEPEGSRFLSSVESTGVDPRDVEASAQNWQDIIKVARAMSSGDEPPRGPVDERGIELTPEQLAMGEVGVGTTPEWDRYQKWYGRGPLNVEEAVTSLRDMATHDPRAGSWGGQVRQRGRELFRRNFFNKNPFATELDYLGAISGQQGLVNPDYYVPHAAMASQAAENLRKEEERYRVNSALVNQNVPGITAATTRTDANEDLTRKLMAAALANQNVAGVNVIPAGFNNALTGAVGNGALAGMPYGASYADPLGAAALTGAGVNGVPVSGQGNIWADYSYDPSLEGTGMIW